MAYGCNGSEALSREQCLELLTSVSIGRIIFTDQALPAVRPVNFAVDDDAVLIRTAPGSALSAAIRDTVVAFEADSGEVPEGTGWSVTVVGHASMAEDYIRIPIERVTGHRGPWLAAIVARS